MRELKISRDQAKEWLSSNVQELKELALQTYPELVKEGLPKSWEELEMINGYSILNTDICFNNHKTSNGKNKNIFTTKEQAEASIALAQLSQLREVYRNGWVPNWDDADKKWIIEFFDGELHKDYHTIQPQFLSFQDEETRDLFLENFRDLIEKAKQLAS